MSGNGAGGMRLVFCGTPAIAVPTLVRLSREAEFVVAAVVTQPDRPSGRGLETVPGPVKQAALTAGIPVFQPGQVRAPEALEFFEEVAPDAVVIMAFGQIIPQRLIEIPPFGWINLHASLLPKYRGAAPIAWAIARGETRTGLTTMRIDAGMDTGPMLLTWETGIGPEETAPELAARIAAAGPDLIVATLRGLAAGTLAPRAQDGSQATHAPRLKREDGCIDWAWEAATIHNRIRGFDPWPGAYTIFRGDLCHIRGRPEPAAGFEASEPGTLLVASGALFAACGGGTWLRIEEVQREGRKRLGAEEFLSGARLAPGERFGGV